MTGLVAIDHVGAQRLAARGLDGPLEPADAAALEGHLATCPDCRRVADAMRADSLALRELDLGPVPVSVRADVTIAAERGSSRGHLARWVGLIAVGAVLVALLGGGALGGAGGSAPASSPVVRVHWATDVVDLQAADVSVTASGRQFTPLGPRTTVHSDPGDATYRTLEIEWDQDGIAQRLYLYFANDDRTWWVNEIRIYNGAPQGEWLYATDRFFESPMGQPWRGDADIPFADPEHRGGLPASLRLTGATLAMTPSDLVAAPLGGGIKLDANARPFGSGGALHCSGILQMSPKQAQAALSALGYRVSWRAVLKNDGYWEARKDPPDGVILDFEPGVGTSGELIIAVLPPGEHSAIGPAVLPADCPEADPNVAPPEPAPTPTP